MAKSNRQRAVLFQRARVQARAFVELEIDKLHPASTYATNRRDCIAAYDAHKAAQVMVADGIIATHW